MEITQTITNETINSQYITITVSTGEATSLKVYVDKYDNYRNISSVIDSDHNYTTEIECEKNTISTIKINNTEDFSFDSLLIVQVISNENSNNISILPVLFYKQLYDIKMHIIKQFHDICHDHVLRSKLLILNFREELLVNAVNLQFVEDSIIYYNDIIKMGNFHDLNKKRTSLCSPCKNNICSL